MALVKPSPSEAELANINDTGRLAYVIDQLVNIAGGNSSYANINDDTATQIKNAAGVLNRVVVNTAGASKFLTLYDGTSNSDPVIAVIDLGSINSLNYGLTFSTGLYAELTTGSAADITVIYS